MASSQWPLQHRAGTWVQQHTSDCSVARSMPTSSPYSLHITATLYPCFAVNMYFTSVVFPAGKAISFYYKQALNKSTPHTLFKQVLSKSRRCSMYSTYLRQGIQ